MPGITIWYSASDRIKRLEPSDPACQGARNSVTKITKANEKSPCSEEHAAEAFGGWHFSGLARIAVS